MRKQVCGTVVLLLNKKEGPLFHVKRACGSKVLSLPGLAALVRQVDGTFVKPSLEKGGYGFLHFPA